MSKTFDYIIIGGGCIGTSIAYHLAKRGAGSVALLERNKFLGEESTGKCAGGVRAQFSTEVNSRLSMLSIERFAHFEQEIDSPLQFNQWGYLFVLRGDELVSTFRKSFEMWQGLGIDAQWLEPDMIAKRFPYINMDGVQGATFSQNDGFADPNDIVQGYAKAARHHGVEGITECDVRGFTLSDSDNTITSIQTSQGDFVANKCAVLACGAWTRKLGEALGVEIPISPYRRQILVTKEFNDIPTPFPMIVDMATSLYFHPESGGILIGMSDRAEPSSFEQSINEDFSDQMLMEAMERCPPLENAAIKRGWAGLYEVTPDHHPIFDWARPVKNAFVCAGFSGHGLMHAPAAGIVTAEILLDGASKSVDVSSLSLERFNNPELLHDEANVI